MRSEAPVDRFRRWTTRFGVGLLLVVVLGALTGTMAVAVSQERVAAYDYDGLSAPAWPDGGSAFAETSPVGRGVGAAVHAYAYDLPVAALVDTGRAQLPGDTFPHALGGEDDTAAPAAEVAGAATTPSVLASTPGGLARTAARPTGVGDDWVSQVASNGKGTVWRTPGTSGNAGTVRIMDPTPQYPNGYVRFYNQHGQPIGLNGNPGPNSATHIPLKPDGTFQMPKGWGAG